MALVAFSCVLAFGCKGEDRTGDGAPVSATVQIQGAGPEHSVEAPGGATALDALAQLQAAGLLSYSSEGEGPQTLVTAINGQANSADGKNWLFAINGQLSVQGAGAYQLQSGDRIVWCYVAWADRASCGLPAAGVEH
jgi:Domain of unknown function (DUF4430)